jgi:hypothetical protein
MDWLNPASALAGVVLGWVGSLTLARGQRRHEASYMFAQDRRRCYANLLYRGHLARNAQARLGTAVADGEPCDAEEADVFAARDQMWEALSEIRLIASEPVITAAEALNKAIVSASPTKGNKAKPLSHEQYAALQRAFVAAARGELPTAHRPVLSRRSSGS